MLNGLQERHRIAQEQFALQARDNDNLEKRNQALYDRYTRIDIEFNRVSDDLLSATNRVEQLRNEAANLRAEKSIWEVSVMLQIHNFVPMFGIAERTCSP